MRFTRSNSEKADSIIFFVPDKTQITKGTGAVSLSEINLSDKITVDYRDTMSGLRAESIVVKA